MAATILEELDRTREEEAARFNYDIDALFEHYAKIGAASGREHVSLPPQRILRPPSAQRNHASARNADVETLVAPEPSLLAAAPVRKI